MHTEETSLDCGSQLIGKTLKLVDTPKKDRADRSCTKCSFGVLGDDIHFL